MKPSTALIDDSGEGAGEGHGAWVPESERSGSLVLPCVGLVDALEERRADGTALAGTLCLEHPGVDRSGDRDQFGDMLEAGENSDIGQLLDDRLDAECFSVCQVLLDAGVLVGEVDVDLGALGEHPGAGGVFEGSAATSAGEDDPEGLGATEVDVVSDEGLEEAAGPLRLVQHQGPGHLDLAHRQRPPVAASPLSLVERGRDPGRPPVEDRLYVGGPEPVTDRLEPVSPAGGGEPVGQRLEVDPGPGSLAFGPLVPVEPHLDRIWPGRCRS